MMRITDYTNLRVGTEIDNGVIQKCPYCNKNGLAEKVIETVFYTHFQAVGFSEKGVPVLEWEWCPQRNTAAGQ